MEASRRYRRPKLRLECLLPTSAAAAAALLVLLSLTTILVHAARPKYNQFPKIPFAGSDLEFVGNAGPITACISPPPPPAGAPFPHPAKQTYSFVNVGRPFNFAGHAKLSDTNANDRNAFTLGGFTVAGFAVVKTGASNSFALSFAPTQARKYSILVQLSYQRGSKVFVEKRRFTGQGVNCAPGAIKVPPKVAGPGAVIPKSLPPTTTPVPTPAPVNLTNCSICVRLITFNEVPAAKRATFKQFDEILNVANVIYAQKSGVTFFRDRTQPLLVLSNITSNNTAENAKCINVYLRNVVQGGAAKIGNTAAFPQAVGTPIDVAIRRACPAVHPAYTFVTGTYIELEPQGVTGVKETLAHELGHFLSLATAGNHPDPGTNAAIAAVNRLMIRVGIVNGQQKFITALEGCVFGAAAKFFKRQVRVTGIPPRFRTEIAETFERLEDGRADIQFAEMTRVNDDAISINIVTREAFVVELQDGSAVDGTFGGLLPQITIKTDSLVDCELVEDVSCADSKVSSLTMELVGPETAATLAPSVAKFGAALETGEQWVLKSTTITPERFELIPFELTAPLLIRGTSLVVNETTTLDTIHGVQVAVPVVLLPQAGAPVGWRVEWFLPQVANTSTDAPPNGQWEISDVSRQWFTLVVDGLRVDSSEAELNDSTAFFEVALETTADGRSNVVLEIFGSIEASSTFSGDVALEVQVVSPDWTAVIAQGSDPLLVIGAQNGSPWDTRVVLDADALIEANNTLSTGFVIVLQVDCPSCTNAEPSSTTALVSTVAFEAESSSTPHQASAAASLHYQPTAATVAMSCLNWLIAVVVFGIRL